MCISFATVLQDKCQSVLTEGAVWANTLAVAPAIIHASKEPDGEVKVSVKILFLDGGARSCFYIRAPSDYVLASLNHSPSQPPQLPLKPSFCCFLFCLFSFFYQIRSHGASYKKQQSSSGRSSRGPVRSILVNLPPSGSKVSHSEQPVRETMFGYFFGVLLVEKKKKKKKKRRQRRPKISGLTLRRSINTQRLRFCLGRWGCGPERYVLSGDCAPRPPLILRG